MGDEIKKTKPHVNVVAAVIVMEGGVVLCQRCQDDAFGLYWEFPGGKVEKGETPNEALTREIQEELGVEVNEPYFLDRFEDETEDLKITVLLFRTTVKNGLLRPLECKDFRIVKIEEFDQFNLAPVDKKIARFLKGAHRDFLKR